MREVCHSLHASDSVMHVNRGSNAGAISDSLVAGRLRGHVAASR